jgi:putative NADH-flavin reductase
MLGYESKHALSNSCGAVLFQRRRENGFMNVVVYGATGKTGSRVIQELLSRGHQVRAVVRDLKRASSSEGVVCKQDDLSDVSSIAEIIRGADAVVSAYAPPPDRTDELVEVTKRQIEAVKQSGNDIRLIVVGGAAGLYVAPGLTLLESGHLPEVWRSIATSHFKGYAVLKGSDINWTYFAPAAFFEPGERTGKFRLGTDHLISDTNGQSRISMEDYAVALVNELEHPQHLRRRFTIGY